MGDPGARGLRKAFIVLPALVLVGLWPEAAFAAGPLDLAAPDIADAVEDTTKTAAKVVEQVPELADQAAGSVDQVGQQAVEIVDEVTNEAGGAVDKVVEDATGAVDKAVDAATGAVDKAVDGATGAADKAVDGATGAVNEATKDKGGSGDQVAGAVDKGAQDATGAAKQATGGGAPADSLGGSGNGARQARPHSSGRSGDGMVKARSTRRAGDRARQQSRNRAREEHPGRPDPLLGLIEAGNEIGDQVEASASGGQPATQGSALPFTGGVALLVALAYASLFCGVGSALLAGTRSRGPSEFRLLS